MKHASIFLFLFCLTPLLSAQFQPDAGIIPSYTKSAIIEVSSGINKESIIDGNTNTFWESGNPLPENYISVKDQNLFLDNENYEIIGNQNQYLLAFDGNTDTRSTIIKGETRIKLYTRNASKFLSLKYNCKETISLKLIFSDGNSINKVFEATENYQLQSFEIASEAILKEIFLSSNSDFELFELAAINSVAIEWVKFDFNELKEVGYISSRHLNGGGVSKIEVLYSNNETDWNLLCKLNPKAVAKIPVLVKPVVHARYIMLRFHLKATAYNKASLRVFDVYDKHGPFGKASKEKASNRSWSESFGVNTIWGWGYGVSSSKLKNDAGAAKFARVASLARSYHRLDWDIQNPGDTPEFWLRENTNDSLPNKWINWKDEYGVWTKKGFQTDACILFNNEYFPEVKWTDPYEQSKHYGVAFGNFFANDNSLVSIVEVGNEPWEYSTHIYTDILMGLSAGIKQQTSKIKVLPCGLQSFDKYSDYNNYMSNYINENIDIDGLNTHIYSYIFDESGERIAINPEDPRSETWSVNNLQKWALSNNYPSNIYVTEFGFDSEGGGDDCTHSNCLSEFEQAIYGLRQAMIFYRLGVEQFYWYFYANVDWVSILHNRSGLVSGYKSGFKEKLAFEAFENVKNTLGDLYFSHIVNESDDLYCYMFTDKTNAPKAMIAWRPSSENHLDKNWVEIPFKHQIKNVKQVIYNSQEVSYKREVNKLKIALSGIPVIVVLR